MKQRTQTERVLTEEEDHRRLEQVVEMAVERLAGDLSPDLEKLKGLMRIQGGRCYKKDLCWLLEVSEGTLDRWGIEPATKQGRRLIYDVDDVFKQL